MELLDTILNKLNDDTKFATDYEITMEKMLGINFVRVVHKEKPMEERYVYNPST